MVFICTVLSLLLMFYLVWRVIRKICFYFREYYTFWNIATAGWRVRKMKTKMRLYMYVCYTDLLDECSIIELHKFRKTMVDTAITVQEFHKLALSYTYAVIFRERNDGSLRGVMFVGIDRKHNDKGSPFTVIRIGVGFLQRNYRGGPYMYSFGIYLFFRELIMHPLTPLYVLFVVFSYKSYCIIAHSLKYSYPRYDHETPDMLRDVINQYALKLKLPKGRYNEDTFVLEQDKVKMKGFLVVLDEHCLEDPHVKFFVERNPGWINGHLMIAIGRVMWSDCFRMCLKALFKKIHSRKSTEVTRSMRRNSFQIGSSNNYVNHGREMDGLCNHHPAEEDFSDIEQW